MANIDDMVWLVNGRFRIRYGAYMKFYMYVPT